MRIRLALVLLLSLPLLAARGALDDRVRAETGVDRVHSELGLRGEGVIVAILDRGIDVEHPDVRNDDGSTRIRFIYDLSDNRGAGDADNPTGVGTVYTRAEIDAALSAGTRLPHRDAVGHGTTTAGLAAGDGSASAGLYAGMAPEAEVVVVKMVSEGAPAHGTEAAEAPFNGIDQIETALDLVLADAEAAGKPVVFLANFGSVGGPTDGTSDFARAIDARFGPGLPGRVFVTGTSDDGGHPNYASGTIAQGETVELKIRKGHAGFLRLDLWYEGTDRLDVEVVTPAGSNGPWAAPTNAARDTRTVGGNAGFTYYHNGSATTFFGTSNGQREILIDFAGAVGDYTIRLTGASVSDGTFRASLNPARIFTGTDQNRFESFVVPGYSVWYGASARNNIAPNSYVLRDAWTDVDGATRTYVGNDVGPGALWPGSGVGPTYDGRLGVTVSAPGNSNIGAYGARSFFNTIRSNVVVDGPAPYGTLGAVSGAAPIVTGIIALMLEADPTLDAAEVKDLLQRTAREDTFTGATPNATWGHGKIDAYAAVQEILATTADVPGPEAEVGLAVAPNPASEATISLALPEATSVRVEVLDALGRRVTVLHDGPLAAGPHRLGVPRLGAGAYTVRVVTEAGVATRRLTVVR
ncbi:MAG: S8 family peptidase [Bacteroidota bacterium]